MNVILQFFLLLACLLVCFFLWIFIEYRKRLNIERGLNPIISTLATVTITPGRTTWDKGIARVTLYSNMIVIMCTTQVRRIWIERRDYETGKYYFTNLILNININKNKRFAHIIRLDESDEKLKIVITGKDCLINYSDTDGFNYSIRLQDPRILNSNYSKTIKGINDSYNSLQK